MMPHPSKERRYPRLPTTKKSKVQEEIERMLEDTDSTEDDVSIKTDDLLQDKSSFTQDYIPKDSEDIKTQEEEDVSQDLLVTQKVGKKATPKNESEDVEDSEQSESSGSEPMKEIAFEEDGKLLPSERKYFCHCFEAVCNNVASIKHDSLKLIDSFQKRLDRTTTKHNNEMRNLIEKLASTKSELLVEKAINATSQKELRTTKSLHCAQMKEQKNKKKESETKLELDNLKLQNTVLTLTTADPKAAENEVLLLQSKIIQLKDFFNLHTKSKDSTIDDLRKDVIAKTKQITALMEGLEKSNRDFRSYKRVVDRDGTLMDGRVLIADKKIQADKEAG